MMDEISRNFRILQDEVRAWRGAPEAGPPQKILIRHDDYHASYVGRTQGNKQFFITNLFVPALGDSSGNEFMATFLFDAIGNLVNSKVDQLGPRSVCRPEVLLEAQLRHLNALGKFTYGDIQVKPFAVEHYGEAMGLIPSKFEGTWSVELLPGNFMAFYEPWDSGEYYT